MTAPTQPAPWLPAYREYLQTRQGLPEEPERPYGYFELDPAFVAYDLGPMRLAGFGGQERLRQVGQGFVPQQRLKPPMQSGPVQLSPEDLAKSEAQWRALNGLE